MFQLYRLAFLGLGLFAVVANSRADDVVTDETYGRASHAYFAGDYRAAHQRLSSAIEAGSRDPRLYYFRGLSALQLGRRPDALLDFERGAELERAHYDQLNEVSYSLHRVQGSARRLLESYRLPARALAVKQNEQVRAEAFARYNGQQSGGREKAAMSVASKPAKPANPDSADPFGAPAEMPAKDDPFAAPTAKPVENDPFAAPAMPAKAGSAPAMAAEPGAPVKADAAAIADASTPDGAMRIAASAIYDNQPGLLWSALPERYQADIRELLAASAEKADAATWDKQFALLKKAVEVLKTKREFILAHPQVASTVPPPLLEKVTLNYDAMLEPLETLLNSELSTLDGFKALDPEKFLATTGGQLIEQVLALSAGAGGQTPEQIKEAARAMKITVAEHEGDSAKLMIEIEGQPPVELPMRKVDGKWLPAQLADGWDENVAKAKAGLAAAEVKPENQAQVMAVMTMAEGVLDQLLAADTAEKFNQVIGTVLTLAGSMMGAAGGAPAMPAQ